MKEITVSSVEIEFQGTYGRETVIFMGVDGEQFFIYCCTDPVFEAQAKADLLTMRSCDGKMVKPSDARLMEWVNLLEMDYGPITVLKGTLPACDDDDVDPQDWIESNT